MIFEKDKVYILDLENQVKFGKLPPESLYGFFKDGRRTSELLEEYLYHAFDNLRLPDKKLQEYDLLDDQDNKLELRVITQYGVSLTPSNSRGAGRKFSREKFLEKIKSVDSYILCDIINFPKIEIYSDKSEKLLDSYDKGITRSKWENEYKCQAEARERIVI